MIQLSSHPARINLYLNSVNRSLCDSASAFEMVMANTLITTDTNQEVDKTLIKGNKLCKNIIGFNANTLYLWAILQGMPVGKYKHTTEYKINNLILDVLNEIYLDLQKLTLKYLMNYMINFQKCHQLLKILLLIALKNVIGEHMFNYCQSNNVPLHKSKKLIGSTLINRFKRT
jgi:hypothetical protein